MTLTDYLHWLPGYQVGLQRRGQNLNDNARREAMQAEAADRQRQWELNQRIQKRLELEAEQRQLEMNRRRAEQQASATAAGDVWNPTMGPMTQADWMQRQSPEYQTARRAAEADKAMKEWEAQKRIEELNLRYPPIDAGGGPGEVVPVQVPGGGTVYMMRPSNPRQAWTNLGTNPGTTVTPITDESGNPIDGVYRDSLGRIVRKNRESGMGWLFGGETPAPPQGGQPQSGTVPGEEIIDFDPSMLTPPRPVAPREPMFFAPSSGFQSFAPIQIGR